jgi:hypothetical protein
MRPTSPSPCFSAAGNHGCLSEHYARTYLATQELIVPRQRFFKNLCERIATAQSHEQSLTIFEPGVGTGDFFAVLLQTAAEQCWRGHFRLVGADFSPPMIAAAQARLTPLIKSATRADLSWDMVWLPPLDLLQPESWDMVAEHLPRGAGMIGCFQFEHYFANHSASPLAARWSAHRPAVMTKSELRQRLGRLLAPGGQLWALDDYALSAEAADAADESTWDRSVVQALTDPQQLAALREKDADVAQQITRHYHPARSSAELEQLARRARARRRHRCWEEVQLWSDAQADVAAIFGPRTHFHPQCLGPDWPAFAAWEAQRATANQGDHES